MRSGSILLPGSSSGQDLSAGRYAQLAFEEGYGVSAQSNAARTTPGLKMDEVYLFIFRGW